MPSGHPPLPIIVLCVCSIIMTLNPFRAKAHPNCTLPFIVNYPGCVDTGRVCIQREECTVLMYCTGVYG